MADCNPNDCAVGVRVTALEKEFDRYRTNSSDTHRRMSDRIGSLEQDRSSLKTKLDDIDTKLDGLASTVSALAENKALSKAEIDELYEILRKAEEGQR